MPLLREKLRQYYSLGLSVLAFAIPFPFIFGSISVILLALLWLLSNDFGDRLRALGQRKLLWCWILYFLLHVVSYFYSEDKHQSTFDIETKLSFLVLPLIAGTITGISKKQLSAAMAAFIAGVTAAAMICLVKALVIFVIDGSTSQFFYHDLVKGFEANAVYFAWYTFCSLSFVLLFPWNKESPLRNKALVWPLVMVQGLFFLLLSSRTLLVLFLVLVVPLQFIRGARQLSIGWKWLMAGMVCLLVLLMVFTRNPIRQRFEDVLVKKQETAQGYRQFTNLTLRLIIWETAWNNITEQDLWLTGCGNGDVAMLQRQSMAKDPRISPYDFNEATIWKYNTHNMYLQSLYMLGIPGLLVFLCLVLLPFALLRRHSYGLAFGIFSTVSLIFMIQESALQTQAGILFYTYFSMLLISSSYTSVKSDSERSENSI